MSPTLPVDLLGALRVLRREGLVQVSRPDRALRASRETLRLGPVTAAIRIARRRTPDAVAVQDAHGTLSYRELDEGAAAQAFGLLRLRAARPGAPLVVGLLCRDHGRAVQALAACGYAGARAVLLNTGSAAPQLGAVMERERVDVVVHDREFTEVVADAQSRRGQPALTVLADALDPAEEVGEARTSLVRMVAEAPGHAPRFPARPGGLVVLTSGTTGVPKGAPRPRVSPLQTAQVLDRLPFPRGAVVLMGAPFFHGTGLSQICLAFSAGCHVVLPGRFEAGRVVDLVRSTRPEVVVLVPTMLHRLLAVDCETDALASIRRVYVGGSALSPDLCARTRARLGDVLHNLYGSTEVGVAAVALPADLALAPGCVGRPPVATRVRILGPDRRDVAPGE